MQSARTLFTRHGYAGTSTPDVVAAAGLSRGALYHHFADKRAVFMAVVEAEAEVVAAEIEAAGDAREPLAALLLGGDAYLAAMAAPGRARLLLIEAPAVLGAADMAALEARYAGRTLCDGLGAAQAAGAVRRLPAASLARVLSAAYDRAALAVIEGASLPDEQAVMRALIEGLTEVGASR